MRVVSFLRAQLGQLRLYDEVRLSDRVLMRGVRTAKVTGAAVTSWVVALPLSDNPRPILAPLTALLVVQLTLYETLRTGLRRVVSVVVGVLFAVAVSEWVQLHWWSLGLTVAVALVIGRLLHLRGEIMEVPISAMLVLAVGGNDVQAAGRVVETLIGAGVGIGISAIVAPPLYVRPASDAVTALAASMADLMRTMAEQVRVEYTLDGTRGWLSRARALTRDVGATDRALEMAEESLRLNPRAMDKQHTAPSLRSGLEALEHCCVSLRGIARSLADRASGEGPEPVYEDDVRESLSTLFSELAETVEAYAAVVGSEVTGSPEDEALRSALAAAWSARDELALRLRSEDRRSAWAWEMHGDLAANVDQMLHDLDSEARAELRKSWAQRPRRQARPGLPHLPPLPTLPELPRLGDLPRLPDLPKLPRARRREGRRWLKGPR